MKLPSSFTTVTPFSKILALFLFILLPIGGFFLGMRYQKTILLNDLQFRLDLRQLTPTISPIQINNGLMGWKTYKNENVTFKYPRQWIEKSVIPRGSGFTQEFADPNDKFIFTFSDSGNYNQVTGHPFADIDEYINMPSQIKFVTIDGQEGRQPLPRAGSENINSVTFFSKDTKEIYTLELQTGNTALDTSETDVKEGEKLFEQILSTFRFLEERASND